MSREIVNITFDYDEDTRSWVYSCPQPALVGGAPTLEEAQRLAGEALGFATDTPPWRITQEAHPKSVHSAYEAAAVG